MITYLIYLTISLSLIIIGGYCIVILVKKGKASHIKPLVFYLGLSLLWVLLDSIEATVQNESLLLFLDGMENTIGILSMGSFGLFLYQYLSSRGKKGNTIFYVIIGITSFFLILRLTNPLHSLYYKEITFQQVGLFLQIVPIRGIGFSVHTVLYALIVTFAMFYVMTHRSAYQRVFHRQLSFTLNSMLAFLIYDMLTAMNIPLMKIPILGHLAIIPGIVFCLYTFQHNLIHLQPIASQNLLDEIKDGILSFSGDGIIVDLNNTMSKIISKPWKKIAGHTLEEIIPELYSKLEEVGLFPTNTRDSRQTASRFLFHYKQFSFDTHVYFTNRYVKVTMHDVTQLVKNVKTTSTLAAQDPLTGIYNRRYSEQSIKERLQNKEYGDVPYCFVVFDIDYFKQINDNFGHQTGDIILKEIALLFKESIRPADIFGRFGGDEFILLLHQVTTEQAKVILDRIQDNIKSHPFLSEDGQVVRPTISVGAITATTAAELPYNDLFFMADEALYQAKEKGRDQIVVRHHTPFSNATYL